MPTDPPRGHPDFKPAANAIARANAASAAYDTGPRLGTCEWCMSDAYRYAVIRKGGKTAHGWRNDVSKLACPTHARELAMQGVAIRLWA